MNQATPPMKPATLKWNDARLRVNIKQTQGMVTRTVKPKPAIALPSLVFQRLLALAVISITAYCVADYPFARVLLTLLLTAYALCLIILPSIWLAAIPIILPMVNLAPWSGRFFLEDFDFFIWVTLASSLWHGDFSTSSRPRFALVPWLLVAFFLTTHCIATLRGLLPLAAVDANAFSSYYSHYNALRVSKALFWAVLLIPSVLSAFTLDRELARRQLVVGVAIGLIGMGVAVLWERGVLSDLIYGDSIYAKVQSLTDFSTDYRITALFSEMHTGGEAVDGYIALTWPFALALMVAARSRWEMGIGTIALSSGLYSALVTFSRGTYIAVGVSLLTFALLYAKRNIRSKVSGKDAWPIPIILLTVVGIGAMTYGKGGYYTLIAVLGIFGGAILLSFLKLLRRDLRAVLMAFLFLAGFALMMRGLLTSKWVSNGFAESLAISLPLALCLLFSGIFIGNRVREVFSLRELGISLTFAVTLIAVCVPALSSSYMKSRFTTTHDDFGGRFEHWQHAIGLMGSEWDILALGMGLGAFPRSYLWGNETEKSSIAALHEDDTNTYLRLSNSMDLAMGQRVNLEAGQPYKLSLEVKAKANNIGSLDISVCRRNIIVPWDSDCISTSRAVKEGQWQHLDWEFNIGNIGDGFRLGRRPLVLRLTHFVYNPQGVNNLPINFIDIDNIKLMDRYGEDHVTNGRFENGLDNWFPTSDHAHLPLHIKNLWVNVYFEQGLLGIIAFLALNLYVLTSGLRQALRGELFALTLLSSLMGFFSVGLIGTLYDVPRVIFLFFLLMFTLLAQDPAQLKLPRPRSHQKPNGNIGQSLARRGSFVQPRL